MILSEIIVKRQHNMVRIAALLNHRRLRTRQIYFLIGYTEEMLSLWLKCPVMLEFQFLDNPKDVVYKYI
jgi:Mitochondrial ribosome subunit S24